MTENYEPWIKRVAQVGLVSKGLVYILFGVLILMALYSTGDPVGLLELVKYSINLGWLGRLTIAALAIGLFCYSGWKYCQMVLNVEGYDKDLAGYFVRVTWLGPFVFYIVLATHGIVQLYKWYTGNFIYHDDASSELQRFLYTTEGKWVIAVIGTTLLVNAFTLFYLAASGRYTLMLTGRRFHESSPRLAKITGLAGYITYGLALFITAILFGISIYYTDSTYLNGQESMFRYLIIQPYGQALLSFIALGTICYGIYFLLTAYYRWVL